MKNLIMYKKGEQSFIRWIKKRIDNNLNFMALLEGETGAGKSWSALNMAYQLDNEFNPREQIAFTFKDLMRIINNFNHKDHLLNKRKYKVIIFDEAQTDLSNREWQNRIHKLFNYLVSTFRHQNIILLFTSPYSDFLDSSTMKLLHVKFEVKGWDKKTKLTTIRPKLLQYNSKMKKFYEHSLFVIRDGRLEKLINWKLNRPPQHLIEPYEEMKTAFTQNLNQEITRELEEIHASKTNQEFKGELNPDSMQPELWKIAAEGYRTQQELADKMSKIKGRTVKQNEISENAKSMRKKGYDIHIYKIK